MCEEASALQFCVSTTKLHWILGKEDTLEK